MRGDFFRSSPELLEGIGEARSRALEDAGITTLAEMLARGPGVVHRLLPGTSPHQVVRWFAATLLLQIDDVDPQLAEAFVDGGVFTIDRLAARGLQTLERVVAAARDTARCSDPA